MTISPVDLENSGYSLLATLHHKELAPFLKPYLFKWNRFSVFYHGMTFLLCFVSTLVMGYSIVKSGFSFDRIAHFLYGFGFAFLVLPLHELLHGIAYKMVGATRVSYGGDIKKFVFYAVADNFVVNYREFRFVALAPFVAITSISVALCFVLPVNWVCTMMCLILVHSMFCGGDFGLLSFFREHRLQEVVTYDDVANKVSYFYSK